MEVVLGLIFVVAVTFAVILFFRRPRKERGGFEVPDAETAAPPAAGGAPAEIEPRADFDRDAIVTGAPAPQGEAPADSAEAKVGPVQFTVYHPQQLLPGDWQKLLAYVHVRSALDAVAADSERRLQDQTAATGARSKDQLVEIRRGALIQIVPQLPGCIFNPPTADVLWLKDWHCGEFEVTASPDQPGYEADAAVNGRVGFFVESVLVGEVPIWALLATGAEQPPREPRRTAPVDPFGKIFVSYAHDDGDVVDRLGAAYKVLGHEFLRDVDRLRSGEEWNRRLLDFIDEADVFQLYWSEKAQSSPYVEQEWRHALARGQDNFIRPLYWRKPLPPPPRELARLHFDYLPPAK